MYSMVRCIYLSIVAPFPPSTVSSFYYPLHLCIVFTISIVLWATHLMCVSQFIPSATSPTFHLCILFSRLNHFHFCKPHLISYLLLPTFRSIVSHHFHLLSILNRYLLFIMLHPQVCSGFGNWEKLLRSFKLILSILSSHSRWNSEASKGGSLLQIFKFQIGTVS